MVSKALDSIMISMIFYYYQYLMRIIDIYYSKLEYKIKQIMKIIYYNYKKVVNKSK